jgi:cystinosin
VEPNDVAFSIHSLLLSMIWLWQVWYYNGCSFRNQTVSILTIIFLTVIAAIFLVYAVMIATCHKEDGTLLNWLDFLYVVTGFKIGIILVSYLPQAVLNSRLGSTEGWNIWGILLDFTGGVLSILQLFLDSWNQQDWTGITGDAAKFGLGLVSIAFDMVFFVQHYILYPKHGG